MKLKTILIRKVMISSMIFFLLFVSTLSYSQIIDYKVFDNQMLDNEIIKCNLIEQDNNLFLLLENNVNDTIILPNKLWLETNIKSQFLLFCLSDTLLRKRTSSFSFSDSICYYYSNNYVNYVNEFTSEINYQKIKLDNFNNYGVGGICILPKQILKVTLPYYFSEKYVFVRLQTMVLRNKKQFWIQLDSNSVYCCKKEIND